MNAHLSAEYNLVCIDMRNCQMYFCIRESMCQELSIRQCLWKEEETSIKGEHSIANKPTLETGDRNKGLAVEYTFSVAG